MSLLYTLGQLVLQIWVNTYINPAELGGNQSRILCLSFCWKELVFLHVLKEEGKHELVVFYIPNASDSYYEYLHGYFNDKGLQIGHISGCNM